MIALKECGPEYDTQDLGRRERPAVYTCDTRAMGVEIGQFPELASQPDQLMKDQGTIPDTVLWPPNIRVYNMHLHI